MQNAEIQTVALAEYQKLEAEVLTLKQRLAWFERQIFGAKSERFVPEEPLAGQLNLFFDAAQAEMIEQAVKTAVAAHERSKSKEATKHQGRMAIPADLPRVEEVIEPQEDTTGMKRIGEDVTEQIEFEAGRIWVKRTVRPKYARPEADNTADTQQPQVVQAPAPDRPFRRMKAAVSMIVHVLISKYVDHLPLYRICAQFARKGLKIPDSTMGEWVKAGAELLEPLYQAYKKEITDTFYLQMDETTLKVLEDGRGKCHLGYLWAVFDPIKKLPFFFYQAGRDHSGPKDLLQRFAGVLQCDGYSVYETLSKKTDDIQLMNCMAHIRREFFEARKNDPQRAETALAIIQKLYQTEEKARNMQLNAEQRLELRKKESAPIFKLFFQWAETQYDQVTPASTIGKAIKYALNRQKNMSCFLLNGNIEIDNNLVENIIRPAAIGRKNYLFAGSHEAAQRTAMLYTFFADCKHHNINPEVWLNDVLNRIHLHPINKIHDLLPHRWKPQPENLNPADNRVHPG